MKSGPRLRLIATSAFALVATVLGAQSQWQDVIRNLRHPDAGMRLKAVEKLGNAGYTAAVEPIAPLVADPSDLVQAAALNAELAFFSIERPTSGHSKSPAQQAFDAGPLTRSALPAPPVLIDTLITAMRDENPRVRFDAVHVLGFVAEPPLPPGQIRALAGELDHYDPIIRTAAARVLGRLQAREAGEQLIVALGDSSESVRAYALEALGLVREDRALPAIRDLIRRGRGKDTSELVLALARIGSPDDLDLFRQRLTDKAPHARRAAVEGLGRLGDRESQPAIEKLFKTDKSVEVRLAAAFALQLFGQTQTHVIASMLILPAGAAQARDYLLELKHAAMPGVQSELQAIKDPRHRVALIETVGYIGTADDIPAVEPFLKERDDRVIRAATNAILRLRR